MKLKWFRSCVLLIGATFLILFGMFACNNPNAETTEVEKVELTFYVEGGVGNLTAKIKDATNNLSASPAKIEKGATVVFTVVPADDYKVKSWKINNTVVQGQTENTYTITNIDKNIDVKVELKIKKKLLEKVDFDNISVTSKAKTGNKRQDIKFNVAYPKFELHDTKKYIDAIISRPDGKEFPVGTKFRIKYEYMSKDGASGTPLLSNVYTVVAGTKEIFGSQAFIDPLKHTELNATHIECKEVYTIGIELPKEQVEDIEIEVVSALFSTESAENAESVLGKTKITIKGIKKLESVTFKDVKVEDTGTEKAVRKASFKVEYPLDFDGETGEFIDAILSLKDGKPFPKGTKIALKYKFNNDVELPMFPYEYTILDDKTEKIYVQRKLFAPMEGKHPPLDAIFATEDYSFTITLPEEATDDVYEINVEYALFATNEAQDIKKSLGKVKFEIKGFGK